MTPSEKKAERERLAKERRELAVGKAAKNMEKIKAGGQGAMVATIENLSITIDEKIAELGDGNEQLHDELVEQKSALDKLSREFTERKGSGNTAGLDTKKFSFAKIGKVFSEGRAFERNDTTEGLGYEYEAFVEAAKGYGLNYSKKDIISSLTGASGGFPLPVEIKQEIIAAARSMGALFGMGIMNDSLEGNSSFSVPMETTKDGGKGDGVIMKAGSTVEGGAITVTRNGYKLANFSPRKLTLGIGITNDLLRQGGNFVENFVRIQAAIDFKNEMERLAINGGGQQKGEPTGILNRSDLTAFSGTTARPITTNGRAMVFQDMKDFEFDLMIANRFEKDAKFLTHPGVMRGPSQQYTVLAAGGTAYPTFNSIQIASILKLNEALGYDVQMTTNVGYQKTGSTLTTSAMMYGIWRNVWVPFWGPMEFLMSNLPVVGGVSAFENDMSWMRFIQMYDVNLVAPDSMMAQKGFLTTGF